MPATRVDGPMHQIFCGPAVGETEPRIERFTRYRDELGRSVPVLIERCIECAAERVLPNLT